jgi:hypothetical protein
VNAPCSLLIILVTCVVSWFGFRSRIFEEKYIFNPEAILAGKDYHRLVTSGFLHAGWSHLLMNMLSLYFFGPPLEYWLGKAQLLLIYFGAIIGGNLLSLYIHRHHDYRAYGASGGVCSAHTRLALCHRVFARIHLCAQGGQGQYRSRCAPWRGHRGAADYGGAKSTGAPLQLGGLSAAVPAGPWGTDVFMDGPPVPAARRYSEESSRNHQAPIQSAAHAKPKTRGKANGRDS